MASGTVTGGRARLPAAALRRDAWWLQPLVTVAVLAVFVVYSTWVAFTARDYWADPYLSPFYSPCLAANCQEPTWQLIGDWWKLSPALLVLPIPLGFRLTCYYYRKAYYRAFWLSPPACAVAEPHGGYTGETRFPLILQNIHRWFWYAAVVVALILSYDVVLAFGPAEGEPDGIHMGLGTVLMLVNVVLIWLYTLSCHSCRHITGGRLRHFSKHPVRYKLWTFVSKLNARHANYAWYSLFSVALVDLYIALLSAGVFDDPRFF
jgi:hypothetical protein